MEIKNYILGCKLYVLFTLDNDLNTLLVTYTKNYNVVGSQQTWKIALSVKPIIKCRTLVSSKQVFFFLLLSASWRKLSWGLIKLCLPTLTRLHQTASEWVSPQSHLLCVVSVISSRSWWQPRNQASMICPALNFWWHGHAGGHRRYANDALDHIIQEPEPLPSNWKTTIILKQKFNWM